MGPVQWAAVGVIAAAVVGVARGADVRLVLLLAAVAIAAAAGDPAPVVRTFLDTFSNEKFVVPICSAMGFAYVLRHTGCDRHLVRLLVRPLRHVRFLLVPGVVAVGFVVNVPVISQTSTAVCLGPVVVPLMRAAGFRPATVAAALCLGASVGGELLNPGAPELLTVRDRTGIDTNVLALVYVRPLLFPYVVVAGLVFWVQTMLWERREIPQSPPVAAGGLTPAVEDAGDGPINLAKAVVPLVPLVLLFLAGPPFNVLRVPTEWLADKPAAAGTRLIGAAMLVGVAVAAAASPMRAKDAARHFFDGAGYGFATIVSLIVTANCFGKAIDVSGLSDALGRIINDNPGWLTPLAALVPCGFAAVSGSGMASTQSLYGFFHGPAEAAGCDPAAVGAVVSVASAAGRTMSPAAAVTLMCGTLTGVRPFAVVARVAGPLAAGLAAAVGLRLAGVA